MSERTAAQQPGLRVGGEPRADLLPPEVHERAKAAKTRRLLGILVVLALVVAIAAYGVATLYASGVEAGVSAAQQKTAALLAEQQKYSAAVTASSQVATIESAEKNGAASDVEWDKLYAALVKDLDPGVTITSGSFSAPASWEAPLTLTGPWRYPHVVEVDLELTSSSPAAGADFLKSVATLPSYADATIDNVTNGKTSYTTDITLELNSQIYSNRFAKVGN